MKNNACLMFPQKDTSPEDRPATHDIILVGRDHDGYVIDYNTT